MSAAINPFAVDNDLRARSKAERLRQSQSAVQSLIEKPAQPQYSYEFRIEFIRWERGRGAMRTWSPTSKALSWVVGRLTRRVLRDA